MVTAKRPSYFLSSSSCRRRRARDLITDLPLIAEDAHEKQAVYTSYPDFNVDGQGFYEEDVALITANGYELINPPLPYLPADIEKLMARLKRFH